VRIQYIKQNTVFQIVKHNKMCLKKSENGEIRPYTNPPLLSFPVEGHSLGNT